ncbi:MAG: DeoR/GlpR family DNA-binding transcription regulator [Microbacteriaceae bacterium]
MKHDRQAQVLDLLESEGFRTIKQLALKFEVNESTIRRDLYLLEKDQLIERTHGGALPTRGEDKPAYLKEPINQQEKIAIGAAMAERVLDGQTILLDSGTTTLEVAKRLKGERITVITNDIRIGYEISRARSAHLVIIGGELLPNVHTIWGVTAVEQIKRLNVDVAIFGADAVSSEGITNTSSYEIELKQTMLAIAKEAFFVADSSKFGREALFKVFGYEKFTAGITDSYLDPIIAASFPIPIIRVSAKH